MDGKDVKPGYGGMKIGLLRILSTSRSGGSGRNDDDQ